MKLPITYTGEGHLLDASGDWLADCYTYDFPINDAVDNAEEIARRVNLHDELVAALRAALCGEHVKGWHLLAKIDRKGELA